MQNIPLKALEADTRLQKAIFEVLEKEHPASFTVHDLGIMQGALLNVLVNLTQQCGKMSALIKILRHTADFIEQETTPETSSSGRTLQ